MQEVCNVMVVGDLCMDMFTCVVERIRSAEAELCRIKFFQKVLDKWGKV